MSDYITPGYLFSEPEENFVKCLECYLWNNCESKCGHPEVDEEDAKIEREITEEDGCYFGELK